MIGSVCAEEVVVKMLFVGCQRCDYRDLYEVGRGGKMKNFDYYKNTT